MSKIILPTPYDGWIVSCKFPQEPRNDIPGPKIRSVLILETFQNVNKVLCVYGTSRSSINSMSDKLEAYHFEIDPSTVEGRVSGLSNITRFDFRRTMPIEYTSKWFVPFPGLISIKLGVIHKDHEESILKAFEEAEKYLNRISNMKFNQPPKKETIIVRKKKKI